MSYSIDIGIHPDATGGHTGSEDDPYPMQIALTQGILVPERGDGPYTGFTPVALASFNQIKVGDILIFRVFDTKSICRTEGRSLKGVRPLAVTFTNLDGSPAVRPWSDEVVATFHPSPTDQLSLAFTSVSRGMKLPCYFQLDSSDGIVTYTVLKPNTTNPVPFLFSVVVQATLATPEWRTFYYQDDPEMVISPDEDPPSPDQSPVIAAMSR